LVSGRYNSLDSTDSIKSWVRDGGTLITIGSAVDFATSLLVTDSEEAVEEQPDEQETNEDEPIQKRFIDARNEQALELISGAIFQAKIDPTHPLFYGFESEQLAVFRNHNRILERAESPYANPLVYDEDQPLLAGYASAENLDRLAGTPGIVVHSLGRGRIIMLTDNMNFRGFWLGTQRVFLNAVFFGEFTNPPNPRD